ncbi:hypothetical protein ACFSBG_04535 [Georgenia yuyongxinii]|nr:hypothetical protein [Georgenia yuyongxinii]
MTFEPVRHRCLARRRDVSVRNHGTLIGAGIDAYVQWFGEDGPST